jgi:PKD domain
VDRGAEPGNYGWPYCATAELPYGEAALLRVDPRLRQGADARRERRPREHRAGDRLAGRRQPDDLEFGPDGALYVLEYGDGFFAENPDPQLARIDYVGMGGSRSPVPVVSAEPATGSRPLTVTFPSEGTTDPDGDRLRYAWDFDADGRVDSNDPNPTFTYTENGVYDATLTVTDLGGRHRG